MKKREALEQLRQRDEKRMKQLFGPKFGEALQMAIEALDRQPNYKLEGRKGGLETLKRHGRKKLSTWGKMGGRSPSVQARARELGVNIPKGVSRQRAWKIVKDAEAKKQ
jgi:hypothetical protein